MIKRGIYKISVKGKVYYGSCKNFEQRKKTHLYHLSKGNHFNKRLQNLWNKGYHFDFEFIEEVEGDLLKREQDFLNENFEDVNCINLNPIAGYPVYKRTPETIAKQLETKKRTGNWGGGDHVNAVKAMVAANTGTKRSVEAREKMSKAAKERSKKYPERLRNASDNGRKNRWKAVPSFYLIKDNIKYGPYRRQRDVPKDILSNVSVSNLWTGKKINVKGYIIEKNVL